MFSDSFTKHQASYLQNNVYFPVELLRFVGLIKDAKLLLLVSVCLTVHKLSPLLRTDK